MEKDGEGMHSGGREREESGLAWGCCDRVQWTHSVRGFMVSWLRVQPEGRLGLAWCSWMDRGIIL